MCGLDGQIFGYVASIILLKNTAYNYTRSINKIISKRFRRRVPEKLGCWARGFQIAEHFQSVIAAAITKRRPGNLLPEVIAAVQELVNQNL